MYDAPRNAAYDGLVLFSGPGGSSHGLRMAGVDTVGVEMDKDAVDTATKMGLQTIQGDVTTLDPRTFYDRMLGHEGPRKPLVAQFSPPCPGFSQAGKGVGRTDLPLLVTALEDVASIPQADAEAVALEWRTLLEAECEDERSPLTFEPIRWIAALNPEYVFMEQVPGVLVVWEEYAKVLRAWGYSVWVGKVFAEQYGVPQTRIRAFLIASRVGDVHAPVPTHSKFHNRTPKKLDKGVEKWVSMAEALGWGLKQRPYPTVMAGTASGGADPMMIGGSGARKIITDAAASGDTERWTDRDLVGFPRRYDGGAGGPLEIDGEEYRARDFRAGDEPAFTITEKVRSAIRFPGDEDEAPIAQIAAGRTGGGRPRPIEDPSPTITGGGTAMWVWDEETYQNPDGKPVTHMGDVVTTRGTIRPLDEPAPTLTGSLDNGNTRFFDGQNPPEGVIDRELIVREVTQGTVDGLPRLNNQSGTEFDMAWPADRPAPVIAGRGLVTMPGANANRFNGATKSRNDGIRVTVQEAAVLQSFPEDWSFQGSKTSQYQQVGNAVPPLLQYAIARQVL